MPVCHYKSKEIVCHPFIYDEADEYINPDD